jgi:hypothetical protein
MGMAVRKRATAVKKGAGPAEEIARRIEDQRRRLTHPVYFSILPPICASLESS